MCRAPACIEAAVDFGDKFQRVGRQNRPGARHMRRFRDDARLIDDAGHWRSIAGSMQIE